MAQTKTAGTTTLRACSAQATRCTLHTYTSGSTPRYTQAAAANAIAAIQSAFDPAAIARQRAEWSGVEPLILT